MCRKTVIAAGVCAIIANGEIRAANRPNIVFVFSDDHATQAISAYGSRLAEVAPTPNIDRLAENGVRFNRCMVGNSICGPSRATVLTGKHSHINGFMQNEHDAFDGNQPTFPKMLQKAGYKTALVGKWHLGSTPQGFDYWEILPGQGQYYNPDFITESGKHREDGYVTDLITAKAKTWIGEQARSDEPFMIMVQHKAPHRHWLPALRHLKLFDGVKLPEPGTLLDDYNGRGSAAHDQDMTIAKTMDMGRDLKVLELELGGRLSSQLERMTPEQREVWDSVYQPRNEAFLKADLKNRKLIRWKYQRYLKDYLRCIRAVDESVGELMDYLKETGLAENTVFVYSSDQGFYLGEHGWFDKRFMYDESFRTPLLVAWPGVAKAGSVNSDLVSNLDFAETFLDMAGVEIPDDMQGLSLVPLIKGEKPAEWRDSLYYHYYEYPGWHMVHRHEGVYDGRYKLMNFYDLGEWELYDLQSDPKEMTNQYGNPKYAAVVRRMKEKLNDLRRQYDVPENVKQSLENVDRYYHSEEQAKRARQKQSGSEGK